MHQGLTGPLLDEAQIALLCGALGEDDLRAMLSELPRAARQALDEIRTAVASDNIQQARCAAHALKGLASSFGAARLAAIACEFEHATSSIASISQAIPVLDDLIGETSAALAFAGFASAGAGA
jgi:histidine phosphotransfer protein HptB